MQKKESETFSRLKRNVFKIQWQIWKLSQIYRGEVKKIEENRQKVIITMLPRNGKGFRIWSIQNALTRFYCYIKEMAQLREINTLYMLLLGF